MEVKCEKCAGSIGTLSELLGPPPAEDASFETGKVYYEKGFIKEQHSLLAIPKMEHHSLSSTVEFPLSYAKVVIKSVHLPLKTIRTQMTSFFERFSYIIQSYNQIKRTHIENNWRSSKNNNDNNHF